MKQYLTYIKAVLLLSMLAACNEQPAPAASVNTCIITPELKKLIQFDTVNLLPVNQELDLTGSVNYDQDHIYSYQSLVTGVVQKVHFKLGDLVRKGQVLAEVRTMEISTQKAEMSGAQATLQLAERKLQSTKRLHSDGVASDKDVLEATNDVTVARAAIERITETLTLQGGNIDKGVLVIKAPISGHVVEKKMTAGTQIDAGEDGLFVLSDLQHVWIMANVYAAQLGKVQPGQPVEITTTAYPGRVFTGKINRLSNMFDAEERVLKAIIELNNKDLLLKPSMMVSVNTYQRTYNKAIAIPKTAVLFTDNRYRVLHYQSDCDINIVPITPLASDKDYYYVDPAVIPAGSALITQNQLLVYNQLNGQ